MKTDYFCPLCGTEIKEFEYLTYGGIANASVICERCTYKVDVTGAETDGREKLMDCAKKRLIEAVKRLYEL